ncbi:MAG: aminomethyl-transferring glycine dehydrogenase subunit GcvPB [Candidatus Omnitrophota bacterium]|nr:MAG: aminomethyl-transferring glycine dehydrogenase subunit GcvPB [Candidatus Omnitrophota bacterium]
MDRKTVFAKKTNVKEVNYVGPSGVPLQNPQSYLPQNLVRKDLPLPHLGEADVVRHFLGLAQRNFSIDTHFYPLGSCTMKYNPKINEDMAKLDGFVGLHPYQAPHTVQGTLELLYELEQMLCEITGMQRFTFQPSSGAHGELAGMLMIRKYHQAHKRNKTKVIVPDSAHGTNPATASMCGYQTVVVESTLEGLVDVDKLKSLVDDETAAIMLTNPNTLGLFEEDILKISDMIHKKGGFLYYDGANFNALLGITKPALMGFDVVHLNLHKTFSTPHGCGGPGAGAVGVTDALVDYLPVPLLKKESGELFFDYCLPHSIGKVRAFYGNFAVLVRAYTYLLRLGSQGLRRVAHNSVLNANYVKEKLKDYYEVPFPKRCMHEVIFSCKKQKERGASAYDIAKRLIDYGIHPPTMYFPLTVPEAFMVEPTETESRCALDYFIEAMRQIDREISQDLDKVKSAPHTSFVKRVDETKAARSPDLRWRENGV